MLTKRTLKKISSNSFRATLYLDAADYAFFSKEAKEKGLTVIQLLRRILAVYVLNRNGVKPYEIPEASQDTRGKSKIQVSETESKPKREPVSTTIK